MVSITPKATEKLGEVLNSNGSPGASVKLGAVRGPHGCIHGWRFSIEDKASPEDFVVSTGAVRLLMEPELVDLLEGASIDYVEDSRGIGFIVDAPEAGRTTHQHGGCHHG